jgi:hypothetical protein
LRESLSRVNIRIILVGDLPSDDIDDSTNHGTSLTQENIIRDALKEFVYNDVEQAHGQEQIFHIKRGLSEKNTAGIETVYLPEIDSDLGTNYGTQ